MEYRIADVRDVLEEGSFDVFAHGVNCKGSFGSGIARIVKDIFPKAKLDYIGYQREWAQHLGDNFHLLGSVAESRVGEGKSILHCFTQYNYGYDGGRYGSYDAIDKAFRALAVQYTGRKISFPLIGCGLAGMHWPAVSEIIDDCLRGADYECIVRQEDIEKYKIDM